MLFNGRPLAIPFVAENVPAIIEAWHLGVEAGNAVLDILFGDEIPTGKLTMTFPNATGQCPMYYAHINTGRPGGKSKFTSKYIDAPIEPLYPFGYGLSYTEYEYSDITVKKNEDLYEASIKVKNIGERDGEEIVQCYVRDVAAGRVRPVKELKAFEKVALKAGEEKQVKFTIKKEELGYYNWNMEYVTEDGEYIFYIGKNSRDCLEASVKN